MPRQFVRDVKEDGWRSAWHHFKKRRHLLPLAGYLILALATAWSFKTADDARDRVADQTRSALIAGCERANDNRQAIIGLVAQTVPPQRSVEKGLITEQRRQDAIAFAELTERELAPVDCVAAYPQPKS